MTTAVSLKQVVGGGYKEAWNFKGRYLVIKGGRGSKKSKTIAIRWIHLLQKHSSANLLVVRKVFDTLRDSAFADLQWATYRLETAHLWKFTKSPLQAEYLPTGQKILFRGLDNPLSITSVTVNRGFLSWCWFEEAFQIEKEDDFDKVDMSIRGDTGGLFKQIVLTFNPWVDTHWLKRRFFDPPNDDNKLAITTNYMCNEFLDEADVTLYDWMKRYKPKRYRVEGLGEWGVSEGIIFDEWEELDFDPQQLAKRPSMKSVFALDFGYTNDPSAFVAALVDDNQKELYIFDEHYEGGMLNSDIAAMIKRKGYAKEMIIGDSSEPKSIDELKRLGIPRIRPAQKGKDSVNVGIQFIKQFRIFVHPRCKNMMNEFNSYAWRVDKTGRTLNEPEDNNNHLCDALRYSLELIRKPYVKPRVRVARV